MDVFSYTSRISAPAAAVFAWHEQPDALLMLLPPWEGVDVLQSPHGLAVGQRAVLRMRVGPIWLRWVAEHTGYEHRGDEGGWFEDVQVRGPFAAWKHRHTVRAIDAGTSELEDRVEYRLRGGALGRAVAGGMTRRKLARMFEFRHGVTKTACEEEYRAGGGSTDGAGRAHP